MKLEKEKKNIIYKKVLDNLSDAELIEVNDLENLHND